MRLILKNNDISADIKATLWRLIRGDLSINDFEQYVYKLYKEKKLLETFDDSSCDALLIMDYRNEDEVKELKKAIYELLIQFYESCLCLMFPDNTLFDPLFDYQVEIKKIDEQLNSLECILSIESFAGSPPIHESRWYHPAKLCRCVKCKTPWLVFFEESDVDYYFVRLNEDGFITIKNHPIWPNAYWPASLKDWRAFVALKFKSWHDLYEQRNNLHEPIDNFMLNYELNLYDQGYK